MKIKDNAWIEMAGILNITVSDCQTRWTRLRQRYSRERMLRDQETRSGAGKPMRSKWSLFENINFLGKHMVYRKSITNMNLSQPSTSTYQANDTFINSFQPSTSTHEANNSQANLIIQKEVTLPQTSQTSQNFVIASNISGLELERPWTPSPHLSDSLSVNKQVDLIPTPTNNSDMQPAQSDQLFHHRSDHLHLQNDQPLRRHSKQLLLSGIDQLLLVFNNQRCL
ncbi:transcription factor adf-1-like protein [Lasius niger]|uniref:Transcription factor adf-1-like protein n=1 Tax=Lasius niger TaxID=67767 RepID=A0A0J7KEK8_LASNI|nr:transcription factor adf-1-like protein [Lasius niger]